MRIEEPVHSGAQSLADGINRELGESVARCYQCGKCSAGCPMADEMDLPPSQVLRLLQLGIREYDEEVLRSLSIWLCLTCSTCSVRCPQEVELPRIMDFLRAESLRQRKVHKQAKDILALQRSFLYALRKHGRMHEISMIIGYKLRTLHLFKDIALAPIMLRNGKLPFIPKTIKGKAQLERIFNRTIDQEGGESG